MLLPQNSGETEEEATGRIRRDSTVRAKERPWQSMEEKISSVLHLREPALGAAANEEIARARDSVCVKFPAENKEIEMRLN